MPSRRDRDDDRRRRRRDDSSDDSSEDERDRRRRRSKEEPRKDRDAKKKRSSRYDDTSDDDDDDRRKKSRRVEDTGRRRRLDSDDDDPPRRGGREVNVERRRQLDPRDAFRDGEDRFSRRSNIIQQYRGKGGKGKGEGTSRSKDPVGDRAAPPPVKWTREDQKRAEDDGRRIADERVSVEKKLKKAIKARRESVGEKRRRRDDSEDGHPEVEELLDRVGGYSGIVIGANYETTRPVEHEIARLCEKCMLRKDDPQPVTIALQHVRGRYGATVWHGGEELVSDVGTRIDGAGDDAVVRAVRNACALLEIKGDMARQRKKEKEVEKAEKAAKPKAEVIDLCDDDGDDDDDDDDDRHTKRKAPPPQKSTPNSGGGRGAKRRDDSSDDDSEESDDPPRRGGGSGRKGNTGVKDEKRGRGKAEVKRRDDESDDSQSDSRSRDDSRSDSASDSR